MPSCSAETVQDCVPTLTVISPSTRWLIQGSAWLTVMPPTGDAGDAHARRDHAGGQRRRILAGGGLRDAQRHAEGEHRGDGQEAARPEHVGSVAFLAGARRR